MIRIDCELRKSVSFNLIKTLIVYGNYMKCGEKLEEKDVKKYLSQIRLLDTKIKHKEAELNEVREYIDNITPYISRVKVKTHPIDKISDNIASIIDLEEQIRLEKCRMLQIKDRIINEIQSLDNPVYIDVLYKRYVEYKALWKIAEEMKYSYIHIKRLHKLAINDLKKFILYV